MTPTVHTARHTIEIEAAADTVYRLVADTERWPVVLGPTVHVRRLEGDDTDELLALWATANGSVRNWTSRRKLDPHSRRIDFRQVTPSHPVAGMGGTWALEPLGADRTRVVLDHDFAAVDDDPDAVAWIDQAMDRNSHAELAAIKENAERSDEHARLTRTFADSVHVDGSADDIYAFLRAADRWPERLPHVQRLDLTEEIEGLQIMVMDTRAPDGDVHTTRSVRVCFDDEHRIVYKQIGLPALLAVHTGEWTIVPDGDGVLATSAHTVRVERPAIRTVLGDGATGDDALAFVRRALGTNSLVTLNQARVYAEAAGATRG
ncbi:MAG TPA: aromatase/cyclase [Acidimicrobiales bacterium]|nr:aromatase/cyclase [Acidimicrobiales bacterium]